ncbi:caspase domain-containing protein [Mycena sanguinolenta]|nr:caspase domain-containing protein [Mycena sanguinolenta]
MPSSIPLFGLLIGIDQYKSGALWNLESCVEDAKSVHRWLVKDLQVPKDQLCLLLDKDATKDNIERCFSTHLIHNTKISHGDAIVIYFAGHGSTIPVPANWFHRGSDSGTAEVLCSYDFGHGGVAGISDRSLHAMLADLCEAKGDNITLILDSCFSPIQSPANMRERHRTRWTPSEKVSPRDLLAGLWSTASKRNYPRDVGFYNSTESHTLLAACSPGEKAMEGKEGGKFTAALLETARETSLHNVSCTGVLKHIRSKIESQSPFAAGLNVKRPLFDALPFLPDGRYFQTELTPDSRILRIGIGAVHGVVEGTEFSIHLHNYCGSCNPPITSVSVIGQVYPTWCFARTDVHIPAGCWAQIRRWKSRETFGVRSRKSLSALRRPSLQSLTRSFMLLSNA